MLVDRLTPDPPSTSPVGPRWTNVLRSWQWVMLITLVFAFAFQGSRGLWEPDEGRYTAVAMEMLASGDFVTPYRHHHHIHPTKPPMTYWAIAASVALFGHHEWAVRAPYALAFTLTVLLVFRMGQHLTPALPGLPAMIYASMLLPYLSGNIVTTDVFLTLFVTAGATALLCTDGSRAGVRWMWLAFGLAFLTKGPPALLPLLGLILAHRGSGRAWRTLFEPVAVLGFLVTGLTWYVVVVWRNPGLLSYLFHDELIARSLSDQHGRSPQWWGGLYVYGLTLLVGTLPHGWHLLRYARKRPLASGQGPGPWTGNRLLWGWLVVPLIVFVLARSRLPMYLLPLFPAIALLVARSWLSDSVPTQAASTRSAQSHPAGLSRRLLWIPAALIVLLGLKAWAAVMPSHQDMRAVADDITRTVPFKPAELVFVDTRPKYGLAFYLGVEAEWLDLGSNRANAFDDSLSHELKEDEGARLYLVKPERVDDFVRRTKALGEQVESLGLVGGYRLFGLRREADHQRN